MAGDNAETKTKHRMRRHVAWIVWGKGKKREKEGKNVQTPVTVPCSDWGRLGPGAGGTACRTIGL